MLARSARKLALPCGTDPGPRALHRAILQALYEVIIPVEADKIDRVPRLFVLLSDTASAAPCAIIGFEANTPRSSECSLMISTMIWRAAAWLSATFSATISKAPYLAAICSLNPLAR